MIKMNLSIALLLSAIICGCGDGLGSVSKKDAEKEVKTLGEQLVKRYDMGGMNGLTKTEEVFLMGHAAHQEIDVGGFVDFYFNEWGGLSEKVAQAYEKLQAPEKADLIRRADALFEEGVPPPDLIKRRTELSKLSDEKKAQLNELGLLWRSKTENMTVCLYQYIHTNQDRILE